MFNMKSPREQKLTRGKARARKKQSILYAMTVSF